MQVTFKRKSVSQFLDVNVPSIAEGHPRTVPKEDTSSASDVAILGAGIAQFVEYPTEKPGAIQTGSSPRCGEGLVLPESTSSADSLTVSVQPPCEIACINICVHVKNPKHWQPHHCLEYRKIIHTLIRIGSAALASTEPYPGNGKTTRISGKGPGSTELQKNGCA